MIRVLFLIHDLGHGGAEKVLVNLVNNMDPKQFEIHVTALFGGGINEQFLASHIHYRTIFNKAFPGNSHMMKLFSPRLLHKWFIKEKYDIEIAYLEGPTARIISGCSEKKIKRITWIHCTTKNPKDLAVGFRSVAEAQACYGKMNAIAFVSETAREAFLKVCSYDGQTAVLYNTNESGAIIEKAANSVILSGEGLRWCGVGRLIPIKGFDRMVRIQKRLVDNGYQAHLYILGEGQLRKELEKKIVEYGISDSVTLLGYQTNPYKYVKNCDLFVCSSHSEGFSTAATEALIVGTPVCTVEVSGMKEMLGEHDEYGIVTGNSEEALYQGIRRLLDDPALLAHYKEKAKERGRDFSSKETVRAVEEMLRNL